MSDVVTVANNAQEAKTAAASDAASRTHIAYMFIIGGALMIVAAGITDVALDHFQAATVFTSVLGVAGTWVSTILVFYFSRENFQVAQASVAKAVDTAKTDSNLSAAMTPIEKLKSLEASGDDLDSSILLGTLCAIASSQETPVPILANTIAKYIIHNASLYRFITDRSLDKNPVVLDEKDPNATTLKEMTSYVIKNGPYAGKTYGDVTKNFLTLSPATTLSVTRANLGSSDGAQDIVVTQSGDRGDKMLWLLTCGDLAQIITT